MTDFDMCVRGRQSRPAKRSASLPPRVQEMRITLRKVVAAEIDDDVAVTASEFLIGRSPECHLRPACPMVSRMHCELKVRNEYVAVRDLGSKNGTFVNGVCVTGERQLFPGDRLSFGMCLFEIAFQPGDECMRDTEQAVDDACVSELELAHATP